VSVPVPVPVPVSNQLSVGSCQCWRQGSFETGEFHSLQSAMKRSEKRSPIQGPFYQLQLFAN
jgi:hypothetical protein